MMGKTPADEMADLAKLAGGFVEAVIEQEVQALHMIEALARPVHPATPAEAAAQQAETEAGFDNMPI